MTWFKIFPIMITVMTIVLSLFYSLGTKQEFLIKSAVLFLSISCVVSILICVFGYYGFKYLLIVTFIANIAAVVFACFSYMRNLSGWQDLIGTIIYVEIVAVGVFLGLIIEIIVKILNNRKKY